jgi:probable rRNA maturation factor
MNILIRNDQTEVDINEAFIGYLYDVAETTLGFEKVDGYIELSVALVDEIEIRELNSRYRGNDVPTDVLSFEVDSEMMGDVIICPSIAKEQAVKYGQTFKQEMSLLLVHGILHLLGYDHIEDSEAEIMEAKEKDVLAKIASGPESPANGGGNGIG